MDSITCDSNIYISALEFGGIGERLIGLSRYGKLRIDTSDAILDETIGVLRDKFAWDGYRLHFARIELAKLANVVTAEQSFNIIADLDDNKILECAVEAGSDYIVTNDQHLLKLKEFQGIPVITPAKFLSLKIQR